MAKIARRQLAGQQSIWSLWETFDLIGSINVINKKDQSSMGMVYSIALHQRFFLAALLLMALGFG